MTNICFIANFYKTDTMIVVAEYLKKYNVNTFWIIPKKRQYDRLLKMYDKENLLLIDRSLIELSSAPMGDFKINELLFGDRVWKYEKKEGKKYLLNIQKPIFDFITKNNIHLIFGESTWAHELLIHRMCKGLKNMRCSFYSYFVARVPNGKIFFNNDEKDTSPILIDKDNLSSYKIEPIKVEKPDYLKKNDIDLKKKMSLNGILKRFRLFITNENIEPTDPNVHTNRFRRMKVVGKEIFNQITYPIFVKREKAENVYNTNFVFFGFHKQPEASIDVCGRYFENQYENVVNIWRQLPNDWKLVIKEHSNAIGDRSVSFFKKLQKLPGVILVDEYADSLELIKRCKVVITNTGTMALEAALMRKPAITLSKVAFNKLNYCRHCTWQDFEQYDSLETLVREIEQMPDNRKEYAEYVQKNSFDCNFTDVVSDPNVLDNDNILKIVSSFLSLIKYNEKLHETHKG